MQGAPQRAPEKNAGVHEYEELRRGSPQNLYMCMAVKAFTEK